MKKINLIQFLPYFPPHAGGVEKVGEDIFLKWTYGKSLILSGNICQQSDVYKKTVDNNIIYFFPCIDIVDNFIFPSLWTRKFWKVWREFKKDIEKLDGETKILTHTRFFLSSLMGGIFARKNGYKWIHLEHGSDYVKLSSVFKSKMAYVYDRLIGKGIFNKANEILAISKASKNFIEKEFGIKGVEVWYRGFTIPKTQKKEGEIHFLFIGRLVHLKGVKDLLWTYKNSTITQKLIIIGDGEEREALEKEFKNETIQFLGQQDHNFIIDYLLQHKCIVINPSYQEGLPTTVIEALSTRNIVIASDVGGTSEISKEDDLILFGAGNISELSQKMVFAYNNFEKLKGKSYNNLQEKFGWDVNIDKLFNLLK